MGAREYLQQLRALDVRMQQLTEQYHELRATAATLSATRYDREPVSGSKCPCGLEKTIIGYMTLAEKLEERRAAFFAIRQRIIDEIQSLSDYRQVQVLYKHYVLYKTLAVVADEIGYSLSHVKGLQTKGLAEIQKIIDRREN